MPIPNNGTIEDVINLLNQTQGINQKVELAGVIGEPSQPSDDISTQIGILSDGKLAIVNAINSKDGEADINDSILDLAESILELPSGQSSVSGTVTSSSTTYSLELVNGTSRAGIPIITVDTQLPFTPTMLYVYYNSGTSNNITITNRIEATNTPGGASKMFTVGNAVSSTSVFNFKQNTGVLKFNSSGFTIPVSETNVQYNWIAYP